MKDHITGTRGIHYYRLWIKLVRLTTYLKHVCPPSLSFWYITTGITHAGEFNSRILLQNFMWLYCCAILNLNYNFYFLWKSAGQISSDIPLISWDEDSQQTQNLSSSNAFLNHFLSMFFSICNWSIEQRVLMLWRVCQYSLFSTK